MVTQKSKILGLILGFLTVGCSAQERYVRIPLSTIQLINASQEARKTGVAEAIINCIPAAVCSILMLAESMEKNKKEHRNKVALFLGSAGLLLTGYAVGNELAKLF